MYRGGGGLGVGSISGGCQEDEVKGRIGLADPGFGQGAPEIFPEILLCK